MPLAGEAAAARLWLARRSGSVIRKALCYLIDVVRVQSPAAFSPTGISSQTEFKTLVLI